MDPAFSGDVQSRLQSTGAFTTVDTFDARSAIDGGSGTPTAGQLAAYDAVLAFSNNPFSDAVLLGDRLATYHDQGRGVVVALFSNAGNSNARMQGAYGTQANGYALLNYTSGSYIYPSDWLGDVLESQSPLMTGVASFAASAAYRSTANVISGRGVVVARWRGGGQEPLVLRGTRGNRTLVELNFFPTSSSGFVSGWTGDGASLLRNALKYSRCMLCGPGTFAGSGAWWGRFRLRVLQNH